MKRKRSFVTLLTASSFVVLAASGILAFVRPFSIQVVGLHALMGFVFVGVIAMHVANNIEHLSRYARSKALWTTLGVTAGLTAAGADSQHSGSEQEPGPGARPV